MSFPRFERDAAVTVLPHDLAVMMVGIAARQAASPTAISYARLAFTPEFDLLSPLHGAFNATVATQLAGWRQM